MKLLNRYDKSIIDQIAEKSGCVLCHGWKLFVYDRNQHEIIRSMDLTSLGCQDTQGQAACEICVTEDGSQILLHPMNQEYVTLVNDITIGELDYTEDALKSFYRRIFEE
ncbi:MAG: hypothetical protein MR355_01760 [Lachnospiraceae bacterium]|nr:hypothetical protein [Lachnospiraceae bacterium]